ncbi:DUF2971 domain-containing protein [Candidatus Avelusimicrobium facis]|uniref:DUF2971 domain-containing protein n=1 Tax=Candidatus Avelusimicrobium facis TaxID=3416203 RepID=UPI003D13B9EB
MSGKQSIRFPSKEELSKFRNLFIKQFIRPIPAKDLLLFRPINLHTLSSLNNFELWFSHPHDFNDPFDCSKTSRMYLGTTDYTEILREIRIRSFSISDNLNNMLLWAHYADGHRGIVITVRPNYQKLREDHIAISPMFYNLPDIPTPHRGGLEVIDDMFLKKDPIWEYEKEYRLITLSTYLKEGHILQADHTRPYFSIQNITFGLKCPPDHRKLIKKMIQVPFFEMIKAPNENPIIKSRQLLN